MAQRHLARSIALQSLAQWDFNRSVLNKELDLEKIIEQNISLFAAPNFREKEFARSLTLNVAKNLEKIDSYIKKFAPHWPLDKITPVDKNTLRIGIWELLFSDIPPKVAINEAVEIAKSFGNITSGKFVNGVLGTIYNEYKKDNDKKEEKEKQKTDKN